MKHFTQKMGHFLFLLFAITLFCPQTAKPQAAPEQYEGVMLQGFYWDSFTETSWSALTDQSSDIAKSFDLIWLPPSGKAGDYQMGYHPVYYFDQNSYFGTQEELKNLISTLKAKGCGAIADIVINHRNGVSDWTDFAVETYKGVTYTWGPWAICSDDEVAFQPGQPTPTGNPDTGDNWDGARDIDHTNAYVQETIKAYLDFMKNEMGYTGWRYDLVKGFAPEYVGIYSKAAECEFSVGECWDGYDRITSWMDGTKTEAGGPIRSGAFDFPMKYALNSACDEGNWAGLTWMRNGTLPQPAGLIHMDGFARFSYTFVDNHDTYRESHSAVDNNILAANAFMLSHPGIPCVFYLHWQNPSYKNAIEKMIEIRKSVGVHSQSVVNVLESGADIYAAEVIGKTGSLVIKVGPKYTFEALPADYELKASGDNYAIWTKGGSVPVAAINLDITPGSGTYEGGVLATLTASGDNAPFDIYYTTDGSVPTLSSTKVASGFQLNIVDNTILKAIAVDSEGNQTSVIEREFLTKVSDIVIRWKNDQNWTGSMNIYAWNADGLQSDAWPGTTVTADANGWYSHTITASLVNVIFNNGTVQTANITNITESGCYAITSQKDGSNNLNAIPRSCDDATNVSDPLLIRWDNSLGWGDVYIYSWDAIGTPLTGVWPGTKIEQDSDGWYSQIFGDSEPVNMIFNNGAGGKTVNIEKVTVKSCYTIDNTQFNSDGYTVSLATCPDGAPTNVEKETADKATFQIYPNPVTDIVYLKGNENIAEVNIVSMSGTTVKANISNNNAINVSDLPNGIYFIRIKTTEGSLLHHKLVKK